MRSFAVLVCCSWFFSFFHFFYGLELLEIYPKCLKIKIKILRRRKKSTKLEFSGFAADFSIFFLFEFPEIWRFCIETRAYTHRPWRENPKIRRYSRKNGWSKIAIFSVVFLAWKQAQLVAVITSRYRWFSWKLDFCREELDELWKMQFLFVKKDAIKKRSVGPRNNKISSFSLTYVLYIESF